MPDGAINPDTASTNAAANPIAPATSGLLTREMGVYERLWHASSQIGTLNKDGKMSFGGSFKFVSHDAVANAVRVPFFDWGIVYHFLEGSFEWDVVPCGETGKGAKQFMTKLSASVVFVSIHNRDDRIIVPAFAEAIDSSDKGAGKAQSYAMKYALLKTLGLPTGEDVDGSDAPRHAKPDTGAGAGAGNTGGNQGNRQSGPQSGQQVNQTNGGQTNGTQTNGPARFPNTGLNEEDFQNAWKTMLTQIGTGSLIAVIDRKPQRNLFDDAAGYRPQLADRVLGKMADRWLGELIDLGAANIPSELERERSNWMLERLQQRLPGKFQEVNEQIMRACEATPEAHRV